MKVEKEDYKEEKTTSAGTKERKTLTSGTSGKSLLVNNLMSCRVNTREGEEITCYSPVALQRNDLQRRQP